MAIRSFTKAARRRVDNVLGEPITFELKTGDPLVDKDGEELYDSQGNPLLDPETIKVSTLTAKPPTAEQLAITLAHGASEFATHADEMASALGLFKDILSPADYQTLVRRLRDPKDEVDIEMISDIISWLVEQWQDFPTQPPSASSRSEKPTGPRSTGRSPGKGSTRSS
jgi:hypothetical protein